MNAEHWQNETDPRTLLRWVRNLASERKLRLFMCACCRLVAYRLRDERSLQAIRAAERFADRALSAEEQSRAFFQANEVCTQSANEQQRAVSASSEEAHWAAAWGEGRGINPVTLMWEAAQMAMLASTADVHSSVEKFFDYQLATWDVHRSLHLGILHEVFGNPFQELELSSDIRSWQAGAVVQLARSIYEADDFARCPLLADLLEEAGCPHEQLLLHLRTRSATHMRGCWALDCVLGMR